MPNGWSPADQAVAQSIAGVVANQPVTKAFALTAGGAIRNKIKIVVSGVAITGSITAKFQTSNGGSDWVDTKSVTISGNGNFYIKHLCEDSGDWTYLPLLDLGRVVITTTNAADAVTVSKVEVLQDL